MDIIRKGVEIDFELFLHFTTTSQWWNTWYWVDYDSGTVKVSDAENDGEEVFVTLQEFMDSFPDEAIEAYLESQEI